MDAGLTLVDERAMEIKPDSYRKFTRILFDRHVNLEFVRSCYMNCKVRDLSISGIFVIGDFKELQDNYCIVNLVQKGLSTGLSLHALAKIARREVDGIALEFTSMPFDSYMFLQVTLLGESDDPFVTEKILSEECPFEVTDELPSSPEAEKTTR